MSNDITDTFMEHYKLGGVYNYFKPRIGEITESLLVTYDQAYAGRTSKEFIIGCIIILISEHELCQGFIDSDIDREKKDKVLLAIAGRLYEEGRQWIDTNRVSQSNPQ